MENFSDFLELLDLDVSKTILSYLDDPADIVRVSAVSRSWRRFVIANDSCKKLFLRLFPEVSSATHAIEVNNTIEAIKVGSNYSVELKSLERNHRVFAFLARGLKPIMTKGCILEAICASSTDNYPDESIQNTLEPKDIVDDNASYWSSMGESDPAVPETLAYRLISNLCFITEINVQPFQAYFQYGFPIYSAKAVRFRMGHLKSPLEMGSNLMELLAAGQKSANDYMYWTTYVSPEFPMAQENCLQKFKLPEPVLCIGGTVQVELLGRVQRQEIDGLFYICVSHVQVVGQPLLPAFDAEVIDGSGKCVLKYYPEPANCTLSSRALEDETQESSGVHPITARFMKRGGWGWEHMILNTFRGNVAVFGESDNESSVGHKRDD